MNRMSQKNYPITKENKKYIVVSNDKKKQPEHNMFTWFINVLYDSAWSHENIKPELIL